MSENKICNVCGGYVGKVIIQKFPAHDENDVPYPEALTPSIIICPGHSVQPKIEDVLDRIIPMMDKIDHLSGERALGREKALTQLCCVIAQIKEDLQTDMEVPRD